MLPPPFFLCDPTHPGRDLLLDDVPKEEGGKGYVSVAESSFVWQEGQGLGVKTFEGLTTSFEAGKTWTIMSGIWNHLKATWEGTRTELVELIFEEKKHQEKLEEAGYRSPTWSLLRALQSVNGAKRLYGESAITAAPIFEAAGRGDKPYWGKWTEAAPTIILWESLAEEDREVCLEEMKTSKNWVVWCRSRKKGNEELE
jgi:hypothetical protein